ncbi:U-box domain-containing protein 33-like isoform X1 [Camellia sinensis]|uniref:UspA domain-containing protein n=1 Tax=Camellia sinensis var. sinensis TaxID=542762 RepID=A0A4S4F3E0_CAMSN|nr:U-box domain-containing protein 33-like isoform X1 [Camellia sinensis]THG23455.1 hypothetical protein TEA_020360 [Camellia sinensis var. sinensis]
MEEGIAVEAEDQQQYHRSSWRVMSPEIVEIGEESQSMVSSSSNKDRDMNDVYVAVGRDDLGVVKWAIDHAVSPGARVFLVHVFPPITYIPTPVGRLSRSQLSEEQVRVYINEDNNRRRHLLQKYIRLCNDAKVTVDTMLLESNTTAKAILDLIPVLNITNLVIGTKRPSSSRMCNYSCCIWNSFHFSNAENRRLMMKGMGKGEYVKKNAPEFCEVSIVYDGKKLVDDSQQQQQVVVLPSALASSRRRRPALTLLSQKNFLQCVCLSSGTKSD